VSDTPTATQLGSVVLHDLCPPPDDFRAEVVRGLGGDPRKVPPKYFYDERGAHLFERICELDAYYLTRTELAILQRSVGEMARAIGREARIVEFGSGSGLKTRLLLEHLEAPAAYVPIDISRAQLVHFALEVAERFPTMEVAPVCADYTQRLELPPSLRPAGRTVAFFPGSSIGNFEPDDAAAFLAGVGALCGTGGGMLIGFDLRKDIAVIEAAYDDPEGVTAEFNLNLLERINRECGADFDVRGFRHHAFFDDAKSRIEMRLISDRHQTVRIPAVAGDDDAIFRFEEGDFITTEYSHKYTPDGFRTLCRTAGWELDRVWVDPRCWFAVAFLKR
jgi:dimethylhistidine N-methyltransferase